jgi:metal-dependent amidase/aminoacylase/carboxypeptidase family protein
MMQHIQLLFVYLAGIAWIEAERLAQARAIFADAELRFGEFETPAYIRRSGKADVSG